MTKRTLPDYNEPPVTETVIGIAFQRPPNYCDLFAGKVWELFEEEFPGYAQHPAQEPQFEIFGGRPQGDSISFNFGPPQSRYWFISADNSRLLQFQGNMLLYNWRRIEGLEGKSAYESYEDKLKVFHGYVSSLSDFFEQTFGSKLQIDQAEITYSNTVVFDEGQKPEDTQKWFKLLDFGKAKPDSVSASTSEVFVSDGDPYVRLHQHMQTVVHPTGRYGMRYELTVRGKPHDTDIESASRIHDIGHQIIVERFTETTTAEAHLKWEREV